MIILSLHAFEYGLAHSFNILFVCNELAYLIRLRYFEVTLKFYECIPIHHEY